MMNAVSAVVCLLILTEIFLVHAFVRIPTIFPRSDHHDIDLSSSLASRDSSMRVRFILRDENALQKFWDAAKEAKQHEGLLEFNSPLHVISEKI